MRRIDIDRQKWINVRAFEAICVLVRMCEKIGGKKRRVLDCFSFVRLIYCEMCSLIFFFEFLMTQYGSNFQIIQVIEDVWDCLLL